MNLSRPFTAVSPSLEVSVLIALSGSTTPRSGREVARRTGRSKTGVQRALDRLVEHGIVERMEAGRALLYSLNRDHLLAPAISQLAEARPELVRRLRATLDNWQPAPAHASLFGSAARGDGDVHSDIDLLVVRPRDVDADSEPWRDQVDDLADLTRRWTGNHASVIEIREDDVSRLRREQPPVIEQVRADAIDLAGEPARALFG